MIFITLQQVINSNACGNYENYISKLRRLLFFQLPDARQDHSCMKRASGAKAENTQYLQFGRSGTLCSQTLSKQHFVPNASTPVYVSQQVFFKDEWDCSSQQIIRDLPRCNSDTVRISEKAVLSRIAFSESPEGVRWKKVQSTYLGHSKPHNDRQSNTQKLWNPYLIVHLHSLKSWQNVH